MKNKNHKSPAWRAKGEKMTNLIDKICGTMLSFDDMTEQDIIDHVRWINIKWLNQSNDPDVQHINNETLEKMLEELRENKKEGNDSDAETIDEETLERMLNELREFKEKNDHDIHIDGEIPKKPQLPRFEKVTIYNFDNYVEEKSNSGGAYGFTTYFTPISESKYVARYYTTADYDYCQYCGSSTDGYCSCGEEDKIYTEKELLEEINRANNDPSYEVGALIDLWDMDRDDFSNKIIERIKKADMSELISIANQLDIL